MADISSPHDSFFRSVLDDSQMALDYFRSALPEHVIGLLDLSTLKRVPDSYVSRELEKTMSDVVYRCQRVDGKGNVAVCLLVEHKSKPDKYTPVQVGGYLFSGYLQQVKQRHKQLSPIIPILFYHGKQKWEYWTLNRLFDELGDELLGFIPKFEYIYANLRDTPDAVVEALNNQFLASSLLILKHYHNKAWLNRNFPKVLLMALSSGSKELQQAFLMYSFVQVEFTEERIMEMIKELPLAIKDKVMSTYEMAVEKGRKEERIKAQRLIEQERAKAEQERTKAYTEKIRSAAKMKKSGFDNAMIADILELSIEEVDKL
ncbi:Rpn family recombination-promoting nuclease/putative transposase [Parapedobacter sp. 10938]|uniref:Rpn family recombination-promoting nuclease/putative transposase n=1 Tax=Parapedobacter flavus TaxID=3110225 RepID=UPI002DB682D9|nr:Rpn family recombination-promoting nuclease/putative transposase [Parapedobacter sp. 10938]MEC3879733.1 Rpn family recombination-promoting nuclease/putative transposase [Parapedobacter sp. 10938]